MVRRQSQPRWFWWFSRFFHLLDMADAWVELRWQRVLAGTLKLMLLICRPLKPMINTTCALIVPPPHS